MKKSTWFGVILGMALSFSAIVVKAETIIGVHTFSYHTSGNYNNTNPGVYVSHNGYTVGTYYNSERHQTVYAGYSYTGSLYRGFEYGLSVGLASGYERSQVVVLVVPSLAYRFDSGFAVRLSAVPPLTGSPGVFHLSIEQAF